MKLSEIKSNPNNPRILKDEKFKKLVKSIQEFPKMMKLRPIVIDNSNMVLGGNMRLKALQELKYKEIPDEWIKRASELTEDEKKRFIIADNVGFGEWDWDILNNDYNLDDLNSWGLEKKDGYYQKMGSDGVPDYEINKMPYPITIVVTYEDYLNWEEMKQSQKETNDLKLFMKLFKRIYNGSKSKSK